jgi:hypothetical protein
MTAPEPDPGVIARWTTRRPPAAGTPCDECASPLVDISCDGCGQLAGVPVGMLATVVETVHGPELVIAERSVTGDWTPLRRMPATPAAVRALARPGATGPQPAASTTGRLW